MNARKKKNRNGEVAVEDSFRATQLTHKHTVNLASELAFDLL